MLARRPPARATSARARGTPWRCGSPRPTGRRASRAGRPSPPAGPSTLRRTTRAPKISSSRRSGRTTIERHPVAERSTCDRAARPPDPAPGAVAARRRRRPMKVSCSPIRSSRSAHELVARADAGPQHEILGLGLELEDRAAVRPRELGRARDDRRQHLADVEARAHRLADLAERAKLVHGARQLPQRALHLTRTARRSGSRSALGGERRHELDPPVVERIDLATARARSRQRRGPRPASARRASCGSRRARAPWATCRRVGWRRRGSGRCAARARPGPTSVPGPSSRDGADVLPVLATAER